MVANASQILKEAAATFKTNAVDESTGKEMRSSARMGLDQAAKAASLVKGARGVAASLKVDVRNNMTKLKALNAGLTKLQKEGTSACTAPADKKTFDQLNKSYKDTIRSMMELTKDFEANIKKIEADLG